MYVNPSQRHSPRTKIAASDETLMLDVRAGQRPAQVVEGKLRSLLKRELLLASHLRTSALSPSRTHC